MGMPTKLIVQLLQLAFLQLHLYLLLHGCAADSSPDICSINAAGASNTSSCVSTDLLYPFAFTSSPSACAFSPSFLLSDCSSNYSQHAAYWNNFTDTMPSYDVSHNIIGPPAVMGISRVNSSTYINVTWDSDLIFSDPSKYISVCSTPPVIPLQNLSYAFPSSIDLRNYADSSVIISDNNVYLLFNCSHSTTSDLASYNNDLNIFLEANTSLCQAYRSHCTIHYTASSPCVQLMIVNFAEYYYDTSLQQLNLQDTMKRLDCTHFQFFVTKTGAADTAVTEWGKAILQLQWTDPNCSTYCSPYYNDGGSCVFDSTNHTFEKCENCKYGEDVHGFCKFPSDCTFEGRFSICHTTTKIAVSVIVIVGTALLLLALCYCRRIYRRRRSMQKSAEKLSKFPWRNSAWPQDLSSGSNESLDINVLSERPMEYSYSSIASATSSFSSKIGEGGFGAVFKGALHDNEGGVVQEIAVKVLEVRSKHSRKQFLNEVAIIGRIHHVNVVRLLGFCEDHEEQYEMLVYEYVVNGSLDTWLFHSTTGKRAGALAHGELDDAGSSEKAVQQEMQLEWGQRYGIALGVARGLSYLHEECRHRIVHCDIKPHNILLDASMCPKIADFGLARLMSRDESRVVTLAKGTPGYMAPEFWVGGDIHLSTKADVYSYGMVLLEIVSGRRNFALGCRRFPAVAFEAAMRGDFESILDARLLHGSTLMTSSSSSTTIDEEKALLMWQQVRTAIFVALWCIQDNPADRPCMSEVVQFLEGIAMVSEKPPLPVVACTTMTTPPLLPTCLNSNIALTSTAGSELTRIIHGR